MKRIYGHVWREAAKIDKLRGETKNKFLNTPEGQEAFQTLENLVSDDPKIDSIALWLFREAKKGHILLQDNKAQLVGPDVDGDNVGDGAVQIDEDGDVNATDELNLIHIADWFASDSPTRRGVDIMQLSATDLLERVAQWDEELSQSEEFELIQDDGAKVVYDFGNGWTMRMLASEEACKYEGSSMNNCIKDERMGYIGKLARGEIALVSLRDPNNEPHVSIEIEGTVDPETGETKKLPNGLVDPRGGRVVQVLGKNNAIPKPKYREMVKQFVTEAFSEEERPVSVVRTQTLRPPTTIDEFTVWSDPEGAAQQEYLEHEGPVHDLNALGVGPAANAIYNLNLSGKPWERQEGEVDWRDLIQNLVRKYGDTPEAASVVGKLVEGMNKPDMAGEMNRFRDALREVLPHLENWFYGNVYDESGPAPEEQFAEWPFTQQIDPYIYLTRDPDGNPIYRPGDDPNQDSLFDANQYLPENPDGLPYEKLPRQSAIAPIYYRWSFSPKTGVTLGHNEGNLDALINYREGADRDDSKGYAYRIGNGWRLTDWEHRPVEDPYVVSQVVKKLQGFEKGGSQKQQVRCPKCNEWYPVEPLPGLDWVPPVDPKQCPKCDKGMTNMIRRKFRGEDAPPTYIGKNRKATHERNQRTSQRYSSRKR